MIHGERHIYWKRRDGGKSEGRGGGYENPRERTIYRSDDESYVIVDPY